MNDLAAAAGPQRVGLTLLVVAVAAVILGLMRWGWVRRGRRQSDVVPLPDVPPVPPESEVLASVVARYLGATRAGDWLDRVVVHGLGVPSGAELVVSPVGVWCLRQGAPDIFLAPASIMAVRHDRAAAGRAYEADGVLVVTWDHHGVPLDLAWRVVAPTDALNIAAAIDACSRGSLPHPTTSGETL